MLDVRKGSFNRFLRSAPVLSHESNNGGSGRNDKGGDSAENFRLRCAGVRMIEGNLEMVCSAHPTDFASLRMTDGNLEMVCSAHPTNSG